MPGEHTSSQQHSQNEQQLRLYADSMSQPCRAVIIFTRFNALPVQVRPVLIHKGETRAPAFLALNPLGKVPMLEDPTVTGEPLRLPESAAIMTYLTYKFPNLVPEHWYPRTDAVHRALVDAALHWYQGNIRAGAMRLMFNKVVAQRLGRQGDERVAVEGLKALQVGLSDMESYWLARGSRAFMTGEQPCIADLLVSCELEQLAMLQSAVHGNSMHDILAPYSGVRAWQQRLRSVCEPHYSAAHIVLRKVVEGAAGQHPKL